MTRLLIATIMIMMSLGLGRFAWGCTYQLPKDHHRLYGQFQLTQVKQQSVVDIMKRYDIGRRELKAANPQADLNNLPKDERLLIPTLKLLPRAQHKGIVINLASMRLYFFPKDQDYFETYPAGIGKQGQKTPLDKTKIVAKAKDPQWRPTAHVRHNFLKENGYPLPPVVMPGPDNPLGRYKLRLNIQAYLIHGTNQPGKIGTRTSAGCIHLFNRDVGRLYQEVALNTPVNIVYQPFIASWEGDVLYFEAYHPIAKSYKTPDYEKIIRQALKHKKKPVNVDWDKVDRIVKEGLGVPEPIGSRIQEQS